MACCHWQWLCGKIYVDLESPCIRCLGKFLCMTCLVVSCWTVNNRRGGSDSCQDIKFLEISEKRIYLGQLSGQLLMTCNFFIFLFTCAPSQLSTLTTRCSWVDLMVKDWTGHPHSYARSKTCTPEPMTLLLKDTYNYIPMVLCRH